MKLRLKLIDYLKKSTILKQQSNIERILATWRNGYAEDCKSLYPGSIPGVASKKNS